jgi:hypothetical protein
MTTNQKDSSAKAMADTVQRLQGEPAARMAKLSQDSSATSGEAQQALTAIEERLALTYNLCCGTAPKQSVGELLAVTLKMPEWETLRRATSPAPQAATPLPEQDERALFEAEWRVLTVPRLYDFTVDAHGDYSDRELFFGWRMWQASAALTQQAAPEAPARRATW